jgi:membrane-bound lytic murein transglycosylase A
MIPVFLDSCTVFVRKPAQTVLEELSIKEAASHDWTDDLDHEGLSQAIDQSIRYYKRLPSTKVFNYGGLIYTPEEMVSSLELFLRISGSFHGDNLKYQLIEKFHFFESKNTRGEAFFTGYYVPLLEGSLIPTENLDTPVYEKPGDLISVDMGQFNEKWKNERIVGRLDENRLIPYFSREEIMYKKSLKTLPAPIAYVNEIELFFLQIQGSGLISLPEGGQRHVSYAGQNGHPYVSIGSLLKDRLPDNEVSLQTIKEYLYEHPDEVPQILSYNPSYVFFREIEGGPLGYLEVPLTTYRSIAMDKRIIPGGTLAFIETEIPAFKEGENIGNKTVRRFVLVQDTGGAIRGHGRVDIFFGHGKDAEMIAGNLKHKGRSFIISIKEGLSSSLRVKSSCK